MLDLLFGQDGCEVFHLKDLADFDFVVGGAAVGATLDPLDGLFEGLDLQDREAGDELLGLGEGAVDDGTRLAGEFDACAFGTGMEAIEEEQDASLDELFVVLAHLGHEPWIGEGAFFSDSAVALTMTMNRIAGSPLVERWLGGLFSGLAICLLANR